MQPGRNLQRRDISFAISLARKRVVASSRLDAHVLPMGMGSHKVRPHMIVHHCGQAQRDRRAIGTGQHLATSRRRRSRAKPVRWFVVEARSLATQLRRSRRLGAPAHQDENLLVARARTYGGHVGPLEYVGCSTLVRLCDGSRTKSQGNARVTRSTLDLKRAGSVGNAGPHQKRVELPSPRTARRGDRLLTIRLLPSRRGGSNLAAGGRVRKGARGACAWSLEQRGQRLCLTLLHDSKVTQLPLRTCVDGTS
ncbi:hypothetical protein BC834DRAFT_358170 [Gloeopeniophorella convolvens]|nr:hypothetical protein BC834DRAFT_430765 [Gloeopeniophorella convolvens]KAI0272667.1 hypothetical protein BC834DRAFT_358170 [Gloeopeniophorella convolvens]